MNLTPLYDVKLIADGKQHFYTIGDNPTFFPGVTTVLGSCIPKPALLPWALNSMGENIKDFLRGRTILEPMLIKEIDEVVKEAKNVYKKKASDAADIGSRVHKAIDDLIHRKELEISSDIAAGVEGFRAWNASHSLKIELGDTKIGSKLFGYGGSLDFLAFDKDGGVILWDLKTTKKRKDRDHGVYDEYAYQLAAYCQAFTETYGIPVKEAYILWVNKEKPEFKAVKVADLRVCLDGFLTALKMYQIQKYEKFEN